MWLKHIVIQVTFVFTPLILLFHAWPVDVFPAPDILYSCTGFSCQCLGAGVGQGAAGAVAVRGQGLPHTALPAASSASTAGHSWWWNLWESILKKRENTTRDRRRVRGWETAEGTPRCRKEKKEKVLHAREGVHAAAYGEPMLEKVVISWRPGALGGAHAAAGGKWGKNGAAEKKLLCTDCTPLLAPLGGHEWTKELGGKERSWVWKKGKGKVVVYHLSFLTTQICSNWYYSKFIFPKLSLFCLWW